MSTITVKDSAKKAAKLIKGAEEIYYPGLPHGLTATHAELVNRDLLAFCQQGSGQVARSTRGATTSSTTRSASPSSELGRRI